jgi:hypothetical protein
MAAAKRDHERHWLSGSSIMHGTVKCQDDHRSTMRYVNAVEWHLDGPTGSILVVIRQGSPGQWSFEAPEQEAYDGDVDD